MSRSWRISVVAVVAAATAAAGAGWSSAAQAAPSCTANAGGTGLSAKVVASDKQQITDQVIDASGCDIGIYVGAGAGSVVLDGVTVSGANFTGILAEKTTGLTVKNSMVDGNGFHSIDPNAPPLPGSGLHSRVGQAFGISLFGVTNSAITGNQVFNNGRGGIGVMDNGPFDPGSMTQNPNATLLPSTNVTITGNQVWRNFGGCAIVAATQNLNGALSHLTISGNTVVGTGMSPTNGPDIGGLVVAANLPGSSVSDVAVSANTIDGSFEGGVIVNAEAPGAFTKDVTVSGNTVRANNWGHQEAPDTAGIIVFAAPGGAANIDTVVSGNTASDQYYGIWTYKSAVSLSGNTFPSGITVPVSQLSLPTRVLDTRAGIGAPKAPVAAGKTITLTLAGVPAGATAALLNLTAVDLSGAPFSYVSACPAANTLAQCKATSALNVSGAAAVANEITVPIAADGKITLYNDQGSVDLVADLAGYLTNGFAGVGPTRVLDTRSGIPTGASTLGDHQAVTLTLTGLPAGATAAVLNLAAVGLHGAGTTFVAVCPAATPLATCKTTSALNVSGPAAVANEITVPIAADGKITLYNDQGSVDLVADLAGYLTSGFTPVGPTRVLDTRMGGGAPNAQVGAHQSITLSLNGMPAGATAAVLNLTVVGLNGAATSFVSACPVALGLDICASTSAVNVNSAAPVANEVTVPINSDGQITLYNDAGNVDLIADLAGYLTTAFAS